MRSFVSAFRFNRTTMASSGCLTTLPKGWSNQTGVSSILTIFPGRYTCPSINEDRNSPELVHLVLIVQLEINGQFPALDQSGRLYRIDWQCNMASAAPSWLVRTAASFSWAFWFNLSRTVKFLSNWTDQFRLPGDLVIQPLSYRHLIARCRCHLLFYVHGHGYLPVFGSIHSDQFVMHILGAKLEETTPETINLKNSKDVISMKKSFISCNGV